MKFQIIKGQRHVTHHRKVMASISKRISRFNSGLKSPYAKVRWLYYNHFIFFYNINIHLWIHGGYFTHECEISVVSCRWIQTSMLHYFKYDKLYLTYQND